MNDIAPPTNVGSNAQLGQVPERGELTYPPGYCLDPNGVMCAPADSAPHYDFGYEVGFREAMNIKMGAIDSYVAAERERWAAIARSHENLAAAMGAPEKARTAASILAEGLGA